VYPLTSGVYSAFADLGGSFPDAAFVTLEVLSGLTANPFRV
jgi:hypothetical protein